MYNEPKAEKDQWKTYISCQLKHIVLRNVAVRMVILNDMLSKSGDSLEVVHLEMVENVTAMEICKPYLCHIRSCIHDLGSTLVNDADQRFAHIPPVLYPIFWHD